MKGFALRRLWLFLKKIGYLSVIKANSGVVVVEFSIVFVPFFLLFLFTAEICRIIFISSVINASLIDSVRYAANSDVLETTYKEAFKKNLEESISFWPLLFDDEDLILNIKYCQDIDEVINDQCDTQDSSTKPLAVYHVGYHYKPLFFILPTDYTNSLIEENLVYVQEYERSSEASQ